MTQLLFTPPYSSPDIDVTTKVGEVCMYVCVLTKKEKRKEGGCVSGGWRKWKSDREVKRN